VEKCGAWCAAAVTGEALGGQWPLGRLGWQWRTSRITLLPKEGVNCTAPSGAAWSEASWAGKTVGPDVAECDGACAMGEAG
jgi:hypothetical protein